MFHKIVGGFELGFTFNTYTIFVSIKVREDISTIYIPNNPIQYNSSADISIYKQTQDPFNGQTCKEYLAFCDDLDNLVLNVTATQLVDYLERVNNGEFETFNRSVTICG